MPISEPVRIVTRGPSDPVRIVTHGPALPVHVDNFGTSRPVRIVSRGPSIPVIDTEGSLVPILYGPELVPSGGPLLRPWVPVAPATSLLSLNADIDPAALDPQSLKIEINAGDTASGAILRVDLVVGESYHVKYWVRSPNPFSIYFYDDTYLKWEVMLYPHSYGDVWRLFELDFRAWTPGGNFLFLVDGAPGDYILASDPSVKKILSPALILDGDFAYDVPGAWVPSSANIDVVSDGGENVLQIQSTLGTSATVSQLIIPPPSEMIIRLSEKQGPSAKAGIVWCTAVPGGWPPDAFIPGSASINSANWEAHDFPGKEDNPFFLNIALVADAPAQTCLYDKLQILPVVGHGPNVLVDGDMESGLTGTVGDKDIWSPVTAQAIFVNDPRPGSTGTNSIDITPTVDPAGTMVNDTSFNLVAGKSYKLSVWLKVMQGNIGIAVHPWNYSATFTSDLVPTHADWQLHEYYFVCTLSGYCHVHISSVGTSGVAHARYDDVTLEEMLV